MALPSLFCVLCLTLFLNVSILLLSLLILSNFLFHVFFLDLLFPSVSLQGQYACSKANIIEAHFLTSPIPIGTKMIQYIPGKWCLEICFWDHRMSRMTVNADCCALKENIQNAKLSLSVFSLKELMMKRPLGGQGGRIVLMFLALY